MALRDLQYRSLRFAVSLGMAVVVFTITLELAGMSAYFDVEVRQTLDQLAVDSWVVSTGASGPFFGAEAIPTNTAEGIAQMPGVTEAAPVVFRSLTIRGADSSGANLFGVRPGKVGSPTIADGRMATGPGEVAASSTLGRGIGESFTVAGTSFEVVGIVGESTLLGGTPNIFMPLEQAQEVGFGGAPIITAVAVRGTPTQLPAGFGYIDRAGATHDLMSPLGDPKDAIAVVSVLLWIVAGAVIGSFIYLSVIERLREFAVMKATGFETGRLVGGLLIQALIVAVAASLLAVVAGVVLAPLFPMPIALSAAAAVLLVALSAVSAGLASAVGARRAMKVDPAAAFG